MTATENLWPEFALDEVIRSPKTILNEQAEFLAKGTKNLLTANVHVSSGINGKISYLFEIIAPNLKGYKYNLFSIEQGGIFFYPCTLFGPIHAEIGSENGLINALKEVFNNDETKKVIRTLIAQSKSEVPA